MEFVSPEGLRVDGRRPLELRQMRCHFGVVREAEGSVTFESGNTKILASVFGPHDAGKDRQEAKLAKVSCRVSTAPFSSGERRKRSRYDRQTRELAHIVQEAFQMNIVTELLPKSTVEIFIHVLQADGGIASAALNAAFLAVADAGIPMRDIMAAASVSVVEGTRLLDVNYLEETAGGTLGTVLYQRNSDRVMSLSMERGRLSVGEFSELLAYAVQGCKTAAAFLRQQLLEHTEKLAMACGR